MFEIKETAFYNILLIVLDYLVSLTSYYRRKEVRLTLSFITQNNSSLEHWTNYLRIIISFHIMLEQKGNYNIIFNESVKQLIFTDIRHQRISNFALILNLPIQ